MNEHMVARQAALAYRSTAVTVPPVMAVVMLYDGVITSFQRSIQAIRAHRMEAAHGHLLRATAILRGLDHNLDFELGGACAERLHGLYIRFIFAALHAFGRPDAAEQYDKITTALTGLRESWASVAGVPPRAGDRTLAA